MDRIRLLFAIICFCIKAERVRIHWDFHVRDQSTLRRTLEATTECSNGGKLFLWNDGICCR